MDLQKHIKLKHNDRVEYQCNQCEFKTKDCANFGRHCLKFHLSGEGADEQFSSSYMCHVCNKVYCQSSTLSRHLKKIHQFKWPSGHNKFRYKLESDGYFRLQTLRYESLELVKELSKENEENGGQIIELAEESQQQLMNEINIDLRDITLTDVSNQTNATSISTNTALNENNYAVITNNVNYTGDQVNQPQTITFYNEPTSQAVAESYYAPVETVNHPIIINNMQVVITNEADLNYNPEQQQNSDQYTNQENIGVIDLNSTMNRQFLNNLVHIELTGGESSAAEQQANDHHQLPSINAISNANSTNGPVMFASNAKFDEFDVESFLNYQLRQQQQQNPNQHLQNQECNTTIGVADNSSFMLI